MTASFFEESDDMIFWGDQSSQDVLSEPAPQNPQENKTPLRDQSLSFDTMDSTDASLLALLQGMKPSFLAKEENKEIIRQIYISSAGNLQNPSFLIKKENTSILLGTGFWKVTSADKTYASFPDMRLPFSEKDNISAWVILEDEIDMSLFETVLPVLDFPHIYASRTLITNIRNNISNAKILDKCRFFEILNDSNGIQKIGECNLGITADSKYFCLWFGSRIFAYPHRFSSLSTSQVLSPTHIFSYSEDMIQVADKSFEPGEIITFDAKFVKKQKMKFTFDTFYIDGKSIGVQAGYVLKDRAALASGGIVLFTLQENTKFKTIQGHIFIDSRGFVHRHEVMTIHKELIKAVRISYEQIRASQPDIDRGQLVQKLKKEITKYAYVLTGRTPVVMPVIVDAKTQY